MCEVSVARVGLKRRVYSPSGISAQSPFSLKPKVAVCLCRRSLHFLFEVLVERGIEIRISICKMGSFFPGLTGLFLIF
jgi:hypothetical protein